MEVPELYNVNYFLGEQKGSSLCSYKDLFANHEY